jgi:hypothetical protein
VIDLKIKIDRRSQRKVEKALTKAPPAIRKGIQRKWNVLMLEFRQLMQDRHLEGGTTHDRLARRTSTLYNALMHEAEITDKDVKASVWFLPIVKDYAPTHEFGDETRNIPARMNMRREWKGFEKRFVNAAEKGAAEGIRNAR